MPVTVVRSLGIHIDADVSMRSHVTKAVSGCFAVLRQLRSIRRSVPRSVLHSPVAGDISCLVAAGLRQRSPRRYSVVPCHAASVCDKRGCSAGVFTSRFYHITPLLCQLHWLMAKERIDFKLAVLMYKCLYGTTPSYLYDDFFQPADLEARRCLRSALSPSLIVRRIRRSTISDRAFPVAGSRVWNSLPQHVTSAPSLPVFRSRLKTHFFRRCFPRNTFHYCIVPAQ